MSFCKSNTRRTLISGVIEPAFWGPVWRRPWIFYDTSPFAFFLNFPCHNADPFNSAMLIHFHTCIKQCWLLCTAELRKSAIIRMQPPFVGSGSEMQQSPLSCDVFFCVLKPNIMLSVLGKQH